MPCHDVWATGSTIPHVSNSDSKGKSVYEYRNSIYNIWMEMDLYGPAALFS
jgi:hypothetical protein